MRTYDKYRNTKFIQKSDVERGILITIDKVTEENVAPDSQAEEIKYVINFKENYKPWAPGIETLDNIKCIAGTGNVDDWPGTKLVLFVDPDVKFGRKKVGGIRCRAPKNQSGTQQPTQEQTENEPHQDIQNHVQESKFCGDCGKPKDECSCIPF